MTKSPIFRAFTVIEKPDGKDSDWHEIGAVWKNYGEGYTLTLKSLPLTGRIILLPPKDKISLYQESTPRDLEATFS